jgi:copper(I)-binding protein
MRATRKTGAVTGSVVVAVAVGATGVALLLWPGASPGAEASAGGAGAKTSGPPKLSVSGAYVREPANPDVAAAYFTVRNSGGAPDELTRVTTSANGTAELHASEGGKMGALVTPRVPAGGTLGFQPGAYHVMLMNPGPLKAGDRVKITLVFETSAPITVDAPVVGLAETAPTS